MSVHKCSHFFIEQLVDPITLADLGEDGCWELFDVPLLITMDRIFLRYSGLVVINNWKDGGPLWYRGYRPKDFSLDPPTLYDKYSQHRLGRAFDFHVEGVSAPEIRQDIRINQNIDAFVYISRVELEVMHMHIDRANIFDRIRFFTPPQ